jgi:GMP synthase (glutamine-hydrolysing)
MEVTEIRARELNAEKFINEQIRKISETVGKGSAINALSGGVDSSVVTLLGHKALGKDLRHIS